MQPGNFETLRLQVHNHPGTMSHICGLFSRRAFNLEGIVCVPAEDNRTSTILLQVRESGDLEQIIRQLSKLEDVIRVETCNKLQSVFNTLTHASLDTAE
ncbi:ACT domain-containing protein [Candidatus Pantoea multigeneris]|uniref:acetolactate synthase n=1 Tax=Candidatus Pantoea multigeneris TaxID=2608357 RepID=A0ABX0RE27_9GAMM|nr:ACT domain-containing protein [Pantoea multigeneris]NIF21475.1 ACT domain-containing protein [Pantoea multigeneris]